MAGSTPYDSTMPAGARAMLDHVVHAVRTCQHSFDLVGDLGVQPFTIF
jgi:hypothetical protein